MKIKIVKKINQILNVSSSEWPRVLVAWSMTFLTRFGFIVGWSVLIASFLGKVGIDLLPILFLFNAVFVMLGTTVYRQFLHKVRRETLISFTILFAAAFILSSILFIETNAMLFFALLLIAESVLLAQLGILLALFNEDLFSPLESQRTFPIIESAETIGGIAGGLTLGLLANFVPSYKLIIIWAVSLLAILPIVLRYNERTMEIPKLEKAEKVKSSMKERFGEFRKTPFLKGLMLVIILHWSMMNIIEFQYTKAIQQEVYSAQEETLLQIGQYNHTILAEEEISNEVALSIETEKIYEQAIAQKLGLLHVVFNGIALIIQLVLASRIITSLGIISSLLIHPLIAVLNLIALTLRFSFLTAVFTRGSYELTGLIFKNAYDSSYYAIEHEKRSDVKELMQGIMKPLGAILGTLAIIAVAINIKGLEQTLWLNGILVVMALTMSVLIIRLKKQYTEMSEQNLSKKMDMPTRLNAIEILAQEGHNKNTPALQKILKREEPEIIKRNILYTLGSRQDPASISAILEMLNSEKETLRYAAIKALSQFKDLEDNIDQQPFTKYRIIGTLRDALSKESEDRIKEEIIKYYHEIDPNGLTRFLLKSIQKRNKLRPDFIRMLKLFHDTNLKYYLEQYLNDKSPDIRASSIVALWQFKDKRSELSHLLGQMLESTRSKVLLAGIQASGDIQFKEAKKRLGELMNHKSNRIQEASLLALAKMGDEAIVSNLIENFINPEHSWYKKTVSLIGNLPNRFRRLVKDTLHIHVTEKISQLLKHNKSLESIEKEKLLHLKELYKKVNAHHEVHKIDKHLLNNR